jgi:hypothetical protein
LGESGSVNLGPNPGTVLTLQLPAGSYTVEARAYVQMDAALPDVSEDGRCFLGESAADVSEADFRLNNGPAQDLADKDSGDQLALTTAFTLTTSGGINLVCQASAGQGTTTTVDGATLLATPVGAVNP